MIQWREMRLLLLLVSLMSGLLVFHYVYQQGLVSQLYSFLPARIGGGGPSAEQPLSARPKVPRVLGQQSYPVLRVPAHPENPFAPEAHD